MSTTPPLPEAAESFQNQMALLQRRLLAEPQAFCGQTWQEVCCGLLADADAPCPLSEKQIGAALLSPEGSYFTEGSKNTLDTEELASMMHRSKYRVCSGLVLPAPSTRVNRLSLIEICGGEPALRPPAALSARLRRWRDARWAGS